MKNILTTLLLILMCVPSAHAQTKEEAVQVLLQAVPEINKAFPINATVVTIEGVEYVQPDLTYHVKVNESQVSVDAYRQSLEQSALALMTSLLGGMEDNPELYTVLIRSESNIVFALKGDSTGTEAVVPITSRQIKISAGANTREEAMKLITEYVEQADSTLPQEVGGGMTFKKMTLEGNYIVNYFDTDESAMSIQAYQDYKDNGTYLLDNIIESWKSMDNTEINILNKCILSSGCGIRYVYYGTQSEESVSVDITPALFREKIMGM